MVIFYTGRIIFDVATIYLAAAKVGKAGTILNVMDQFNVFFEPNEFGTAIDIATKIGNNFDEVFRLKGANLSQVSGRTKEDINTPS